MDVGFFGLFGLLYTLFILGLFVFAIYFVISLLKFMKNKQKTDQEMNEKLNTLIEEIRYRKN
ncbi:hypothetical protein ACSVDE_01190 [Pseudalkalibacillus sp. Hm43]|uniref:hypothetical protein n=1 Tax=Pseudalkalibacillus sp. Hm43 TaxID=3450742 RepID=UPI003F43678C